MATSTKTKTASKMNDVLMRLVAGPNEEQLRRTLPKRDKKAERTARTQRSTLLSVGAWTIAILAAWAAMQAAFFMSQQPEDVALWGVVWIFGGIAILIAAYLRDWTPTSSRGILQASMTWLLGLIVLAFGGPLVMNPNIIVGAILAIILAFFVPIAMRFWTMVKLHHDGYRIA